MTTNIKHIGEKEDSQPKRRNRNATNRAAGKVAVVATGVLAALGAAMATVTNVMGKDGDETKQNMVPPNNPIPPIVPGDAAAVDSRTQGVAAVGTVTEGAEGDGELHEYRYFRRGMGTFNVKLFVNIERNLVRYVVDPQDGHNFDGQARGSFSLSKNADFDSVVLDVIAETTRMDRSTLMTPRAVEMGRQRLERIR